MQNVVFGHMRSMERPEVQFPHFEERLFRESRTFQSVHRQKFRRPPFHCEFRKPTTFRRPLHIIHDFQNFDDASLIQRENSLEISFNIPLCYCDDFPILFSIFNGKRVVPCRRWLLDKGNTLDDGAYFAMSGIEVLCVRMSPNLALIIFQILVPLR